MAGALVAAVFVESGGRNAGVEPLAEDQLVEVEQAA
jgi:hypothetical protein